MAQVDARRTSAPRLERSRTDRLLVGWQAASAVTSGSPPTSCGPSSSASFAVGFGLIVYLLTWLLAPLEAATAGVEPPRGGFGCRPGDRRSASAWSRRVLALLSISGLWFGGEHGWPVVLAAIGFAIIWARGDDDGDPGALEARNAGLRCRDSPSARTGPCRPGRFPGREHLPGGRQRAAGDDRGHRRRGPSRRPWVWSMGRDSSRNGAAAQIGRPGRDGGAPSRLGAPDARAHPARQGAARDGEPGPHPGARAARLAVWARSRPRGRPVARCDRLDGGRIERQHQVSVEAVVVGDAELDDRLRASSTPAQRPWRTRPGTPGAPISVYVEVEADTSAPSCATRAAGSTPPSFRPTAAASPNRSSAAWSVAAAAHSSQPSGRRYRGRDPAAEEGTVTTASSWSTTTSSSAPAFDPSWARAGDRRRRRIGRGGGAAILELEPDVVLLDVHMSGGGGRRRSRRSGRRPEVRSWHCRLGCGGGRHRHHSRRRARLRHEVDLGRGALFGGASRPRRRHGLLAPPRGLRPGCVRRGGAAAARSGARPAQPREREVLRYIARGYTYKEVAHELHIRVKTVETHVSAVLRKLQLSSRYELTRWAADRRLV